MPICAIVACRYHVGAIPICPAIVTHGDTAVLLSAFFVPVVVNVTVFAATATASTVSSDGVMMAVSNVSPIAVVSFVPSVPSVPSVSSTPLVVFFHICQGRTACLAFNLASFVSLS